MLPADGIFSEGTSWCNHLVERSYAVAGLELPDTRADLFDNASNVVAAVQFQAEDLMEFPIQSLSSHSNVREVGMVGEAFADSV